VACPGLAIILVDEGYDKTCKRALLTLPYELDRNLIQAGDEVTTVGLEGERIGTGTVIAYKNADSQDRRGLIMLDVPFEDRHRVANFRLKSPEDIASEDMYLSEGDEEHTIICRCERVTKKEIVDLIRAGCRDMNQIKAALRTGMGACGGKNCTELILRLFREEGVALEDVTLPVHRPPDTEVPLGIFAGAK
jgi:bacterioferritin-associated ferredoxin